MKTADTAGYTTKVTRLGQGYGCRVLREGHVVSEGWAPNKAAIGAVLRDLLRWVDKCGGSSPMASASRARNYHRSGCLPAGALGRPWSKRVV